MREFLQGVIVGESPYQVTYQLQPGQLLLQFNEKLDDGTIDKFIKGQKFDVLSAEAMPRNVDSLRAARMRWVALGAVPESLADFATELMHRHPEIVAATPVYYEAGQGPESAASPRPDLLLVRFKEKAERRTLARLRRLGFERNDRMSELLKPFHCFHLNPRGEGPDGEAESNFEAVARVAEIPGVDFAELDWLKLQTYQLVPNDTLWGNQWDMVRINLVNAWNVQTGAAAVWVAIIDSGFDLTHPDLTFTPNTGANLTHFNAQQALGGAAPPYNAGPSGVPHGTAVAGLATATLNNNAGVAGVAGGCTIMPVRLGTVPSAARVAAGINWAVANGARVANLSLTTAATAAATTAVANAWTAGMILCAATGNNGGNTTTPAIGFPANHANAIGVGASDQADQRKRPASADGECWGSQFGPQTDVVAPGVLCWSTDEQGNNGYNNNGGGALNNWACVNYASSGDAAGDYIAVFDGTSAATPHVAGLAALLISQYPTLSNQQVRDIIERTCAKVSPGTYAYAYTAGRPNGTWHQEMGYGRIDCDAALRYADIMIADHDIDAGAVPSTALAGGVWTPRIFWGYQPYVTTTDQPAALPTAHEPAKAGQDNYVHAVVRNLGPATATDIQLTWHIMNYPGTELIWPADWNAGNRIASAALASLAPGASVPVQALWPQALVNAASAYAHPCMVVQATCAQDVGGDLGDNVRDYNNIAQHNISFAGFSAPGTAATRRFTLPFAVGHVLSRARRATLFFDLRASRGAAVFLDVNPDERLPYIDRIKDAIRKHPPGVPGKASCQATFADDTRLLLECCGCRAEVLLKAGSAFRLLCDEESRPIALDELTLLGATRTTRRGKDVLSLQGAVASVDLPLLKGQVVPMAVIVEAPGGATPGAHYRVDVTQLSDDSATGGVSLDVEARR